MVAVHIAPRIRSDLLQSEPPGFLVSPAFPMQHSGETKAGGVHPPLHLRGRSISTSIFRTTKVNNMTSEVPPSPKDDDKSPTHYCQ